MLRVEAWAVVFASYALLGLAYAWPQDYRDETPAFVVLSWVGFLVRVLQFHVGLLILVIGVAAAFARGRRLFLAATPLVLFTLGPVAWECCRVPPAPPPAAAVPTMRVMSVNLLMVNRQTDAMIAEIVAAAPDVLLLQEYTDAWHAAMLKGLAGQYPYHSHVAQDDSFGVAVYSRTPFVGDPDNRLPLGRTLVPQSRAVVRFGGREVAVYNVHLVPTRRLDYVIEGRLQFADLLAALSAEPLPYLAAGDWNLTGDTPQHRDLRRIGARDAHELAGRGRGSTWPVNSFFRYLPGLRFDHVYLGPGLTAVRSSVGTGPGSDHRPVIADVTWDGPAARVARALALPPLPPPPPPREPRSRP